MLNLDEAKSPQFRKWAGWLTRSLPYVVAIVLTVGFLYLFFFPAGADLRVPIAPAGGDYLADAVKVKNTLETGSLWETPRLGAPFGFRFYDFPQAEELQLLIIRTIGLFTKDFVVVMNLYYLLGYVLSSLTSLFAFRCMSLPAFPAIGMSLLFAFLQTHWVRGEAHLFVGEYYLVPFALLLLLWLANGDALIERTSKAKPGFRITRKGIFGILVCVLSGSGGVYYAFFTAFLFCVVAVTLWIGKRKLSAGLPAVFALCVLVMSVLANLAPSIIYHLRHGANYMVGSRSPAEADLHGLMIIHLLMPVPNHRLPELALMWSRVANVTPRSEGALMAPLGLIGGIGFLILIAIAVWRPLCRNSPELDTLATLNLAAVLLATVGGFGAVFAWTISSSIRAYNRISVFIAILGFAALLIVLQKFQIRRLKSPLGIRIYYLVVGLLLLGGLWDLVPQQSKPADAIRASVENDQNFVRTMESSLPKGALVFQLPYQSFPEAEAINRLQGYDHARGYLYSHDLRWSFGVMKGRDEDIWERNTAGMVLTDMLPVIRRAGFKAIYIDRFGYSDDGQYICGRLSALLGQAPIESADRRLVFYKLL